MPGYMADPPCRVLMQAFIDDSVTHIHGTGDWPCFASKEPNEPDNVVTFYDTMGRQHGIDMVEGLRAEDFGVQVRIRAVTYERGWPRASLIARYLDYLYNKSVTIGSYSYHIQHVDRSSIMRLGAEPNSKRQLWVINCHMLAWMCCNQ